MAASESIALRAGERWVQRGPRELPPPLRSPIGALLLERLREQGSRILQVEGVSGETASAAQLLARGVAVAEELRARGVRPGDVVCTALDNSLEVPCALLGTLFIGAVYAPYNPDLHADDARSLLELLSPRVVLCTPRAAAAARAALPPSAAVVEVAPDNAQWAAFVHERPGAVADFLPADASAASLDAAAVIMCSSGTTGAPKGVPHSHHSLNNLLFLGVKFESFLSDEEKAKEKILLLLPNFWISGLMSNLMNCNGGSPVVLYKKFDVDVILAAVEKYRITSMMLSPPQVSAIAKHPDVERYDVSSLRMVGYGGAALSIPVRQMAERRLNKTFVHFYGQTETMVSLLPGNLSADKPNSVGIPSLNADFKIIDYETGKIVGPNTEGEICLRNRTTFLGYYKNPEATASTIDKDGWVHTGDAGYFDDDGYFYISDRFKELVKYKGIHIAPAEVEGVLEAHEGVRDAAVVGIEHDEDQEHPVGFVVRQEGHGVTAQELLQAVKEALPEYKQLHGGLYFIEEIPRTVTGKIRRRELRQLARGIRDEAKELQQFMRASQEYRASVAGGGGGGEGGARAPGEPVAVTAKAVMVTAEEATEVGLESAGVGAVATGVEVRVEVAEAGAV